MANAPLKVTDLMPHELEALQAAGRISPDGEVIPLPTAPKITPAEATKLDPAAVPAMPEGVAERMEKVQNLKTSFTFTKDNGERVVSEDGGEKVEKAFEVDNPDWAGKKPEDPVEMEDKLRFLTTLLGKEHFTKVYSLFDDRLRVTFRTRTAVEEQACAGQAWEDDKIDGFPANGPEAMAVRGNRVAAYQFVMSLCAIQIVTEGVPGVVESWDYRKAPGNPRARVGSVRAADTHIKAVFPGPLLVAIRNAHLRFEILVGTLTKAAGDPSFWRAASGT